MTGDPSHAPIPIDSTLGIIVVDHGSRRTESNRALEAFVERFAAEAPYAIVEPAHMELAEPSIDTAFGRCVERGARQVVLCPFFLLPGKHWTGDLPRLAAQASAARGGAVPVFVSAPIGGHPWLIPLLTDRIERCRARRRGEVAGCDVCEGEGGCLAGNDSTGPGDSAVPTDSVGPA